MKSDRTLPRSIELCIYEQIIEEAALNKIMGIVIKFLYATWCIEPAFFETVREKMLLEPMAVFIKGFVTEKLPLSFNDKHIENITRKISKPFSNQHKNAKLCEDLFSAGWNSDLSSYLNFTTILGYMSQQIWKGLSFCSLTPKIFEVKRRDQYLKQLGRIKEVTNNLEGANSFQRRVYESSDVEAHQQEGEFNRTRLHIIIFFICFIGSLLLGLLGKLITSLNLLTYLPVALLFATIGTMLASLVTCSSAFSHFMAKDVRLQTVDHCTDYPVAKTLLDSINKLVELIANDNVGTRKENPLISGGKQHKRKYETHNAYEENFSTTESTESKKLESEQIEKIRTKIKTRNEKLEKEYNEICKKNQATLPTSTAAMTCRLEDGKTVTYQPNSEACDLIKLESGDNVNRKMYALRDTDKIRELCKDPKLSEKIISIAGGGQLVSPVNKQGYVIDGETIKLKVLGSCNSHSRLFYKKESMININTGEAYDCYRPVRYKNKNKN